MWYKYICKYIFKYIFKFIDNYTFYNCKNIKNVNLIDKILNNNIEIKYNNLLGVKNILKYIVVKDISLIYY